MPKTRTMEAAERVRKALMMRDAGYHVQPDPEDVGLLLLGYDRQKADRLKVDKRIHNQRRSNRITWEIVEMRRKWLGSDVARRMYGRLLRSNRRLRHKYEGIQYSENLMAEPDRPTL